MTDIPPTSYASLPKLAFNQQDRKNMTPVAECRHPKLNFGSGDYYLFCHDCGRWWAMIEPESHKLAPELANQGAGAQLSGHARIDQQLGETT